MLWNWIFSGIVRVIAGWIGDRPCVTRNILAGAASMYCGVLTITSLSFRTFPTMLLFMLLFGLGGGKSSLFRFILKSFPTMTNNALPSDRRCDICSVWVLSYRSLFSVLRMICVHISCSDMHDDVHDDMHSRAWYVHQEMTCIIEYFLSIIEYFSSK